MRHHDGITGHLFEEATLGRCAAICQGYESWRKAVEEVRKHQPRQKRPAAVRLENEVVKCFGKLGMSVKFYTAVRSTLDVYHGVDAFFEFRGVLVTIDVTINPNKDCGKADVIVHADDFENLPALAGRIAREFATKMRRHTH